MLMILLDMENPSLALHSFLNHQLSSKVIHAQCVEKADMQRHTCPHFLICVYNGPL